MASKDPGDPTVLLCLFEAAGAKHDRHGSVIGSIWFPFLQLVLLDFHHEKKNCGPFAT